jgi:hypothetical protein
MLLRRDVAAQPGCRQERAMSLDYVFGFLNDSPNQVSLLLCTGSNLTGPGGAQAQVVQDGAAPGKWIASVVDTSSSGDWVLVSVKPGSFFAKKRRRKIVTATEELNITVTITQLDSNGQTTGNSSSTDTGITAIVDPNVLLIVLQNPFPPV